MDRTGKREGPCCSLFKETLTVQLESGPMIDLSSVVAKQVGGNGHMLH